VIPEWRISLDRLTEDTTKRAKGTIRCKKYPVQYDAKFRIILMRPLHPDTQISQLRFYY